MNPLSASVATLCNVPQAPKIKNRETDVLDLRDIEFQPIHDNLISIFLVQHRSDIARA